MNIKHLKKIYTPLYESAFKYGIIHWGASKHIKPLKVLQNRACRTILALNPLTGEKELYLKMGVKKLDEVHKTQLMMGSLVAS